MAALTADRVQKRDGDFTQRNYGVAASTTIFKGSMVAINASGFLVPASASTTLRSVGVAQEQVDNSAGANGDKTCEVYEGVFAFANSGTSAVVQADVGNMAFMEDDQTISKTDQTGTLSKAGVIKKFDSDGVWVQLGNRAVGL